MKPTKQIESTLFCFKDGLGDGGSQVSFGESLILRLVVGVHFLLFLASQIQKEHSMEDLLSFLMVFPIRALLEPSFLRQQKKKEVTSRSPLFDKLGQIISLIFYLNIPFKIQILKFFLCLGHKYKTKHLQRKLCLNF